ncbi:tRNA (adenosine(37)-N6)-threonylcarbamoyltransferase complex dimerization subunit type 1 TsaB [Plesiocystis pacifica]|nr:tRNA (adenosine(37)-N6)-threonylcarbamoyltransferase complex dimerization subunit type 1 TsaB [Plesiocystis pacifica]
MSAGQPPPTRAGWMLCLDASAPQTCVALGRVHAEGAELVVRDTEADGANQTSERLHLRLRAALDAAGIAPRDLATVACGRGPGTFTGTRVAVATAKGLALSLGIPVVPVSTLAALAASSPQLDPGQPGHVLALLDARRRQVYGALFSLGGPTPEAVAITARSPERVIELATLIEELDETLAALREAGETPWVHGPGCGPYAEQLPEDLAQRALLAPGPTAEGLWRASLAALGPARAGAVDPGAFGVTYLRQSYAEMGINKPKRKPYRSPFVDG